MAERAEPIMTELKRGERRIEWSAAALGFAILLQTAGIIWWGARIDQRVSTMEQKINATAAAGETLARLDERTQFLVTTVNRLDQRQQDQEGRR
jgi:hypothetical protein